MNVKEHNKALENGKILDIFVYMSVFQFPNVSNGPLNIKTFMQISIYLISLRAYMSVFQYPNTLNKISNWSLLKLIICDQVLIKLKRIFAYICAVLWAKV